MTGMSLYDEVGQGRRRRRVWVAGAVLLVAIGAFGAWWLLRPVPDDPAVAARALAVSWSRGQLERAPFDDDAPADLADQYTALTEGLDADAPSVAVASVAETTTTQELVSTTADLSVTWDLAGESWEYTTQARLHRLPDELTWRVAWDPSLVHPQLEGDLVLRRLRTTSPRADIRAANGDPLVTSREVVDVGIEPRRVEDLPGLLAELAEALSETLDVELDQENLSTRVQDAPETAFVPVLTLRAEDYVLVRDAIQPLPGTVFDTREVPLAPTRGFARFTLGSAGQVTADMLEEQPDRYVEGDIAGRSGLQAAHDERLFGSPGIEVRLVGGQPPADPVLFSVDPVPGKPLTITLDPEVQEAADAAVEDTDFATAMAVVRPSDGHVLALANSSESEFDIARTGQMPPGSTFKVVTTAALLQDAGVTPDTTIDCPNAVTVAGRQITNAEAQQLGPGPFRRAFVNSCNTAFVQLAQDLSSVALWQAGARFGLGRDLDGDLGLAAFGGQVPETGDAADLAATAIGQGRTLVSPLAMASVMATVANAAYVPPRLVLEPEPEAGAAAPDPLEAALAATVQELTRGVVTDGTGTALRDAPGGPVHGKTGTAEFEDAEGTLRTHAWFVGYQGDLALAVVVTNTPGLYGGDVAAPVAEEFLTTLASRGDE